MLNGYWVKCLRWCISLSGKILLRPQNGQIKQELLLPTNLRGRKPAFFCFVAMSKRRNHPCFSLMQPHTIFSMEMQCNGFLRHVLLTRCQFHRLKYSVCPSVYTDDLIFTGKNRLIMFYWNIIGSNLRQSFYGSNFFYFTKRWHVIDRLYF